MNKEMRQELVDKMEAGTLKMLKSEDKFKFDCTACGQCCLDIAVLVNPMDTYMMARSKMARNTYGVRWTHDLLSKRLVEAYRGPDSRIPIATIKFKKAARGGTSYCPFLMPARSDQHDMSVLDGMNRSQAYALSVLKGVKFVCGLHEEKLKPIICRLSPLGRAYRSESEGKPSRLDVFWQPIAGCPGVKSDREQVVSKYMDRAGIPSIQRYSQWWFDFAAGEARGTVAKMDDDDCAKLGAILFDLDWVLLGLPGTEAEVEDVLAAGEAPSQKLEPDEYFEVMTGMAAKFIELWQKQKGGEECSVATAEGK